MEPQKRQFGIVDTIHASRLDYLRATIHSDSGTDYSIDLSSASQDQIWIHLEDLSEHPSGTLRSAIPLKIGNVEVIGRWPIYPITKLSTIFQAAMFGPGAVLTATRKLIGTSIHITNMSYYEYVYQENFDQYEKKGSLRHFLNTKWANLVALQGFWYAVMLLAVCGSMALSPFVYTFARGVKFVLHLYKSWVREVDGWNSDEEIVGILMHDRSYFEDVKDIEKVGGIEEKDEEKTCVDASHSSKARTEKSFSL